MQSPPKGTEFGCLPRTLTRYGDGTFPTYPERFDLIDRKLWKPVSLNRHVKTIYDQFDGMCTANGGCGVMMAERSFRGREHVVLSPEHLYGQVARWGEGASLDSILKALTETGVCTREVIPPEYWRPGDWPEDWRENAADHRMLEAVDLNADFDAVATALQRFRPCLVGVFWPGSRRGGHAVEVTELWNDGREWGIGGPNSWGPLWNTMGFYGLTERQCADFGAFGCWAAGAST